MNEVVNKFLLAGNEFMPEMHLRQPRFTCSSWRIFAKGKKKIQKIKEKTDSKYFIKTN